jgi:hypothetical protein
MAGIAFCQICLELLNTKISTADLTVDLSSRYDKNNNDLVAGIPMESHLSLIISPSVRIIQIEIGIEIKKKWDLDTKSWMYTVLR